jgi:hypothetical protein
VAILGDAPDLFIIVTTRCPGGKNECAGPMSVT